MKTKILHIGKVMEIFSINDTEDFSIPTFKGSIYAGGYGSFPSASLDFPEDRIDLLNLLIKDKECTFLAKISGDSLNDLGIFHGDIILIDKSLFPKAGNIVVSYVDGDFLAKKFTPKFERNSLTKLTLKSANKDFKDIEVTEDTDFNIWGVITWNLHKMV
ncbi:DNA polymerase V [Elizabethkingia anophelis]|nr:DNA polymerase V [Elizabethkingia anophelis]